MIMGYLSMSAVLQLVCSCLVPSMLLQMAWFYYFLWLCNILVYMYYLIFIHSSVNGRLGCLSVLGVVNSAAMNIGVHVSFWIMVFSNTCPGVGLLDHMLTLFNLWRNLHTVLHNGRTNLHSQKQCRRVPFSPYPRQHLTLIDVLNMAILTGVRWHLFLVLIFICLITNSVEHVFSCACQLSACLLWRRVHSHLLPTLKINYTFTF